MAWAGSGPQATGGSALREAAMVDLLVRNGEIADRHGIVLVSIGVAGRRILACFTEAPGCRPRARP